ncbi:hypothetical protein BDV34DRAFT_211395 [Aspergillus parasiticus]|uniref:Fumarylacetoacetase-like C-terminal domain-containing protein n=1 Tax=Aspergillus parasiticus TaxID=5067 RepID=A0A5N6DU08_ASPPA|nr:hypothetical protein BDV34DRAFT_211395 [Aspergillus parasiticus]
MAFNRLVCFAIGDRLSFGDLLSLLCPIERTPIIIILGLNYQSHVNEAKPNVPKYPPIFVKPADALAGPIDTMTFTPTRMKWRPDQDALDYVLGYTAGNDLSARNFKLPEASRMQFGYSKSFDQFGPIRYTIVATSEIPDAQDLRLVAPIISPLSRGMTLRKGTVIMTGTPAGVGFFTKQFLKAGDVVEVEIEGIGEK